MRVCYVVQRYGPLIAGGAEQHCREMAERMLARGHTVEVATTCAASYVDWANAFEPGTSDVNGVVVHRFPVARPRDNQTFNEYNRRMVTGRGSRPLFNQHEWMRMQGPYAPELPSWLVRNAGRFDVVIGFTYLYWPTWMAMHTLTGLVPVVLHPTVHDEPPLRLSIFDEEFRAPDAFALSTPEEIDLIRSRFHLDPPGAVIGIGVEFPTGDGARFRRAFPALGDAPYLVYVGRVDEGKGAQQLLDFFVLFKERHAADPVKLAMVGDPLIPIPDHPDIVVTGFVDYDTRDDAIAGAYALAQPSFFESFSMILTEAFAAEKPALVQGKCAVLRGHARRSGAALPYEGFGEFEAALELMLADPARAEAMGAAGRAYVEREYTWDVVMDRYEQLLERTIAEVANRPARAAR
jgi:glycosyltransferase involved in cell wall biosynthesis